MNRLLKAVYLAGLVAEIVLRVPRQRRRQQIQIADQRVSVRERTLVGLLFLGMLFIPLAYISTSWLDRANYRWSDSAKRRAGGIGCMMLGGALWLFWRSHVDLSHNWSPSLEIGEHHTLVTHGVYERIRHPMYASHWLWSIAQALLLQNWIAGPASFLPFLALYYLRVPHEEQMMLDHFGEEYRAYMRRTGRVIPRIGRPR
jgi:protein-S-isoprenylcysteine O-methyltransferase Ste14